MAELGAALQERAEDVNPNRFEVRYWLALYADLIAVTESRLHRIENVLTPSDRDRRTHSDADIARINNELNIFRARRQFWRQHGSSITGNGRDPHDPVLARLTPREHDVLSALARGTSVVEYATEQQLALGTVCNYVRIVLKKLGVQSRGAVVSYKS